MACTNFRVNPWRRSVCANCYMREDVHISPASEQSLPEGLHHAAAEKHGEQAAATVTGVDVAPPLPQRQPIVTPPVGATVSFDQLTVHKRRVSRKIPDSQQRSAEKATSNGASDSSSPCVPESARQAIDEIQTRQPENPISPNLSSEVRTKPEARLNGLPKPQPRSSVRQRRTPSPPRPLAVSSSEPVIRSGPTQTPTLSCPEESASNTDGDQARLGGTGTVGRGGRAGGRSSESDAALDVLAEADHPAGVHLAAAPPLTASMAAQRPNIPPRVTPRSSRASTPATTPTDPKAFFPERDRSVPAGQPVPPAAPVRRIRSATMKTPRAKKDISGELPSPALTPQGAPTPPLDDLSQGSAMDFERGSELRSTPPRKPERSKASYRGSPQLQRRDESAIDKSGGEIEDTATKVTALSRSASDLTTTAERRKITNVVSALPPSPPTAHRSARPRATTVVAQIPLPSRQPPPPPRPVETSATSTDDSGNAAGAPLSQSNAGESGADDSEEHAHNNLYAVPGELPGSLPTDGDGDAESEYRAPRPADATYRVPKPPVKILESSKQALRRTESGDSLVKDEHVGPPPPVPSKTDRPPLTVKPFNRQMRHTVTGARPARRPPPPPGGHQRRESQPNGDSFGSASTSASKTLAPSPVLSTNISSAVEAFKSDETGRSSAEKAKLPNESGKHPNESGKLSSETARSSAEAGKSPRIGKMWKHLPSSMSAMRERTMSKLKHPRGRKKSAAKIRDSSDEEPGTTADTRSEDSAVAGIDMSGQEMQPEEKKQRENISSDVNVSQSSVDPDKPPAKPQRSGNTVPRSSPSLAGGSPKLPPRDEKTVRKQTDRTNAAGQMSLANAIASALASTDDDEATTKTNSLPLPPRTPPARPGRQMPGGPKLPPRSGKRNAPPPPLAPCRAQQTESLDPPKANSPPEDHRLSRSDGELISPFSMQRQALESSLATLQANYAAVARATLIGLQNIIRKLERVLCSDKRRNSTVSGSVPSGWRQVEVLGCDEDGPHRACCVHVQSTIDSSPMTVLLEPLTHRGETAPVELTHDNRVRCQIAPHMSILRTIQRFEQPLPSRLLGMLDLENSRDLPRIGYVTDSLAEFTDGSLFADTASEERLKNPSNYERQLALLMVQLCSALTHIHRHGIVHRNVGMASILIGPVSDSCAPIRTGDHLLLTSFGYSLSAATEKGIMVESESLPEETPAEWFLYPRDQLAWLDTNIDAMPREVRTAADRGEQLNYSACDAYSCGYLIRDMLGLSGTKELASLSSTSILCKVALGLLQEDKGDRLTTAQARRLLECFLWGPAEECVPGWRTSSSLPDISRLEAWLHEERAHRLAAISLKLCRFKISLEDFLHCRFLSEVSVDDLLMVHSLSVSS